MPKQGSRAEVNTFVKGLITEASPLNFPANASFDEVNFELNRDGTRQRRLGMDFEDGYILNPAVYDTTTVVSTYVWKCAGGDASRDFYVVQVGYDVHFHDLVNQAVSTAPVSSLTITWGPRAVRSGTTGGMVRPGDGRTAGSDPVTTKAPKLSFAAVNGTLVIVGGAANILVCKWDAQNGVVKSDYRSLRCRDVWGLELTNSATSACELSPTRTPSSTDLYYQYNLYNQSWGIPRTGDNQQEVNPSIYYSTSLGVYPSMSEQVWAGLAFQPVDSTATPYERVFTQLYKDRRGADTSISKGAFILNDLMDRGTSRLNAYSDLLSRYPVMQSPSFPTQSFPAESSLQGPTCVAEYAGHAFYAGFGSTYGGDKRSPNLSSYIFFSQLAKGDDDLIKCYQDGDPTSRDSNEIVDTDGGYIFINGAKQILAMYTLGTNLVIFADNGVWCLSGGADYGFSATNYKLNKRSDFGCVSASSVVSNGSNMLYWGAESIYSVSPNQYGDLVVEDITVATIQSLFQDVPMYARKSVKSSYDAYEKKIRWIYKTGQPFTNTSVTNELVFDLLLQAFYVHQIQNTPTATEEVVDLFFYSESVNKNNYLILNRNGTSYTYTVGSYINTQFRDWYKSDGIGVDAKAHLLTGATTAGDSAVAKQAPYIVVHMAKTETGADANGVPINPSSCLVRSQWDWSVNNKSYKIGTPQEAYRYRKAIFPDGTTYDNGVNVVTSKNKLRGRGKALALYFETSPYCDCQLLGWSLTINGNANT